MNRSYYVIFLIAVFLVILRGNAKADLVTNSGNTVLRYDQTTGASLGSLVAAGNGGLQTSGGFIFGIDGNLYVSDRAPNARVLRYNGVTGAFLDTFIPSGSGGLLDPLDLAFGPDGNLYVADYGSAMVRVYDATTGAHVRDISTGDYALGQSPEGLLFGPDGDLYVGDSADVIRLAGTTSTVKWRTAGYSGANQLAFAPDGSLAVSVYHSDIVVRLNPADGSVVRTFTCGALGPDGLAFGPDGDLYVADAATAINQILRCDGTTGAFLNVFVPNGSAGLSVTKLAFVPIGPLYKECLLYDPTKAAKSGSTLPIKLELCDGTGKDLSSSSLTLHAVSVTQVSTSITGPVEDSGNSNPDNDFRFDSSLGNGGGYIFNLKTTGLSTGTYSLNFTVTGDQSVYAAPFQVK